MDKHEAKLAVELNSICENKGIRYFAYGLQYLHPRRLHPRTSIILHDMMVNSTTTASLEDTTIVNWNAPAEFVERKLAEMRARV